MLGGILRGYEDQHARPLLLLHQMAQQLGAARGIDLDGALRDVGGVFGALGHLHAHGVVQQPLHQLFHPGREGGREQQVLALARQQGQHALQFFGKTQVEQAVGFVEDQKAHAREAQRVVLHQVEEAPRGGHHHVGTAAQRHHLRVDGDAAKHHRHARRMGHMARQALQHFAYLGRQFPCGGQHQGAWTPRWLRALQLLQQRQGKRGRLARAGLRLSHQVGAAQDGRNRLGLDGGGAAKAQRASGGNKGRGKTEGGKGHGSAAGPQNG